MAAPDPAAPPAPSARTSGSLRAGRGGLGHAELGLLVALGAAATFGSSGPFAKSLLDVGWSPAALVLARVGIGALILAWPAVRAARRVRLVARKDLGPVLGYGVLAVVCAQGGYFSAIERVSVGVALLLEYLGIVLVVLWMWLRTGRAPGRLTISGMALAAVGLLLVLQVFSAQHVDPVGAFWGFVAALGLAGFYLLSHTGPDEGQLPPVVLAAGGMGVGAVLVLLLGVVGLVPLSVSASAVTIAGTQVAWWLPVGELAVVAAAAAYVLGTVATRMLGPTVASLVGLTEVLFAIVFAWWLLGQLPRPVQLVGGVLVVAGVLVVRWSEARSDPH